MTAPHARSGAPGFVASESGAAMVEFAFISMILFTMILAFLDFGRALYLYNNLTNAAREGARFAAVQFPDPCADETAIRERAANRIREFNGNWAADPAQYVDVTCVTSGTGPPTMVTVTIRNYPFRAITPLPFLRGVTIGSARIPVDATVRFEGANDAL